MNTPEYQISSLLPNTNIHTYLNTNIRKSTTLEINKIVNTCISPVENIHKTEDEVKLKTEGYITFDNFLSQKEVEEIRNIYF